MKMLEESLTQLVTPLGIICVSSYQVQLIHSRYMDINIIDDYK